MPIILLAVMYIGVTIYFANLQHVTPDRSQLVRWLQYGLVGIMFFFGLNVFLTAFIPADQQAELDVITNISPALGTLFIIIIIVFTILCLAVIRSTTWQIQVADIINQFGKYNPHSFVHITAFVLIFVMLTSSWGQLILLGGIEGLAESLAENPPSLDSILLDGTVNVLVALLGIGLFIRRTGQEALERLGLRLPQREDIQYGVLIAIGLYALAFILSIMWALIAPDAFAEQTRASDSLFNAYSGSLFLAFMLALTAGIGEEILFRGALQPIFGIIPTSLFFVLLHIQYTLTPASIMIFALALILAWARDRFSTTTCIIAHFTYNFIPFVLIFLFPVTEAPVV